MAIRHSTGVASRLVLLTCIACGGQEPQLAEVSPQAPQGGAAAVAGAGGATGQAGRAASGMGGATSSRAGASGGLPPRRCPNRPPAAQCFEDADCADLPTDAGCGPLRCDCTTYTCKVAPSLAGQRCQISVDRCFEARCDDEGQCVLVGRVECPHEHPCIESTCDPETGECAEPTVLADGAPCYDPHGCSWSQTCVAGECTGGIEKCRPDTCNDSTCVDGVCEETPLHGKPCDDHDLCTEADRCVANGSRATCEGEPTALDCSALGGVCIDGVCNPSTGECHKVPTPKGTSCEDGLVCTVGETCNGLGNCSDTVGYVLSPVQTTTFDDGAPGWQMGSAWRTVEAHEPVYQDDGDGAFVCPVLSALPSSVDELTMTGPEVDLSTYQGPILLGLDARSAISPQGTDPHGSVLVEVFDGQAWAPVAYEVASDHWKTTIVDVTKHKNAHLRVRLRLFDAWGHAQAPSGPLRVLHCIDNVVVGPSTCEVSGEGGF